MKPLLAAQVNVTGLYLGDGSYYGVVKKAFSLEARVPASEWIWYCGVEFGVERSC